MAERKYSILHIFPSFAMGGQQRRLAALAEAFGGEFTHRIISLDGETGGAALFPSPPAVESLIIEKSGFIRLGNLRRLKKRIAASGADLLCTYNFGSIEAALANAIGPRLAHVHHEDGFGADEAAGRLIRKRSLARRLILSRSQIVTPSKTLEAIAVRNWKFAPERIARIPVGIELSRYRMSRRTKEGPVIVGSVGALRREKNYARLIRCFEKAAEGLDARLVIHGEGPEGETLARLASQSALRDRISLRGATGDVAAALAGIDIFALSSDTEQMPTSLIEAMAAGLPVIATAVGDIPDMLGEDNRGFVAEREDEVAFANMLRALIGDAGLRTRIGAANAAHANAFDAAGMAAAFRRLYLKTIEAAG